MLVDSVTSRTYLQGLLRGITKDHFEVFDYLEWRDSIGLDEIRRRTDVYRPEWLEAVAKLRTDLDYVYEDGRCLKFSGKVKVFPTNVPEFAFTRRRWLPYVWLRPSQISSLKLSLTSSLEVYREGVTKIEHQMRYENMR